MAPVFRDNRVDGICPEKSVPTALLFWEKDQKNIFRDQKNIFSRDKKTLIRDQKNIFRRPFVRRVGVAPIPGWIKKNINKDQKSINDLADHK